MQTIQFTRALKRIVEELRARELLELLDPILTMGSTININEGTKNSFSALLFESRVGFYELSKDPQATRILASLKIDQLYAPPLLMRLMTTFSNTGSAGQILANAIWFAEFINFFNMLKWLVAMGRTCSDLLETEKLGESGPEEQIVEMEIIDYDGTGIDPGRVEQFVSTLLELHTDLSLVFGVTDSRIKLMYVDSGSSFLFGVKIAKAIAQHLLVLFKEFWEKIKYRRFEEFDREVDSLSKGLTFVATLQEQVGKSVIDDETARILKQKVLNDMTTLIGLGVMLPTDEAGEIVDQKKLLAEKRGVKLLGSGDVPPATDKSRFTD